MTEPNEHFSDIDMMLVRFSEGVRPWQVPALRGAIARKAGVEHERFHNHNNETGGFHYRYPLIQYKFDSRQGVPILFCLKEGVHDLHHFFSKPNWQLSLNGGDYHVRIKNIELRKHRFDLCETPRRYHIKNWLPFNSENYAAWTALDGLLPRIALLERLLRNHVAAVVRELGLPETFRFELEIADLKDQRWADYKEVKILNFDVVFLCNLNLPDFIGIGQGSSTGWGVVKRLRSVSG